MAVIQELEELSKKTVPRKEWDSEEIDTLERYYNRVPIESLMKYLPGRTENAIRVRVSILRNEKLSEVTG